MIMAGSVTDLKTRKPLNRRTLRGMGDSDSNSESKSGGGAAQTSTPVSTQVTTQVSPVFNIAAGNTGGGATNQTGSTAMSTTPSVSNMQPFGQPSNNSLPGQGDMLGAGTGSPGSGMYDPYAVPGSTGSYDSLSSDPMLNGSPYTGLPLSAGVSGSPFNMRTILLLGGVGVLAWLLMSSSGKAKMATMTRKVSGSKKKRSRRAK